MEIFAVGGAVRDELLGLPVKDRDFVVVGATPEEMTREGYRPVGRDFPVFLHPQTHEEHALARTERKSGRGYKGFQIHAAPDVTLEEDLARRDLTINAIAKAADGRLIDPFHGAADLKARLLRHVSPAFVEDPVRILRVARFAARFGFSVAPATMALMREMVDSGEVDHLVPERVWQELARGLMEADPVAMLEVLEACGALARVLPEWRAVDAGAAKHVLQAAAQRGFDLAQRFASLWRGADEGSVVAACDRLRAPTECGDMARLVSRHADSALRDVAPEAIFELLAQVDAFRRPTRFDQFLQVCDLIAAECGQTAASAAGAHIRRALAAAASVDAGAIAANSPTGVALAIRTARIAAIANILPR